MSGAGGRSVARLKASYGRVRRLASSLRSCKMRVQHAHHLNSERRALAVKSLLLSHLRDYAAASKWWARTLHVTSITLTVVRSASVAIQSCWEEVHVESKGFHTH